MPHLLPSTPQLQKWNTSIGRLCLGENNQGSVAEGIENKEQWEGPEMEEEGERYFSPCYVDGLHAYDREINLKYEKNLILNKFAVKLCLEYEEKNGEKLIKRELLVSLKGEFYFVKFIVNPEEDDVEPNVILGRSFMRLAKGIADFGNGVITIHPELDPFLDDSEDTEKFKDEWDHLLDIDFGDIPEINEAGPSLSNGKPLTQEEAAREALAIDIYKRFSIFEEERPMIETMTYSDKYKKILDGIVMDKIKLDGEIKKEEEEAIKQVKGEVLQEKTYGISEGCFVPSGNYHYHCEISHLDMPINRDAPILVGRGFLYTCGSILNTRDSITSIFDGVCHQTFGAAKTSLNTKESDSDDGEDYGIQRNSFGAPMYGPKSAKYLNCNDLMNRALAL
ncbi:hypothetical protein Tco_0906728 [Tanacetum coccineum]|uniref:Uncharacterized protein n=1 Tax=Tanacetum coccineum TaxID=301880 RepID=A0ABQ5CI91_9ASTR